MNKLNPFTITTRLKIVYKHYALKLPLKLKFFLLVVLALVFFDNALGVSYTLITNSKMDTIEKMVESKPQLPVTYMIDYKRNLANEFIHHRTIFDDVADCFKSDKISGASNPLVLTLSSVLSILVMMVIIIYQLVRVILVGNSNIYNHIVNLLLSIVGLTIMAWLMRWSMSFVPMLGDSWNWNYLLYIVVNIFLLAALLWVLPKDNARAGTASNN